MPLLEPTASIEYHTSNTVFDATSLTQSIPGSPSGYWLAIVWAFNRSGDIGVAAEFNGDSAWEQWANMTRPGGSTYLGIWWRPVTAVEDSFTVSFPDATGNLDISSHVMRAQNDPAGLTFYNWPLVAEMIPNNSGLFDYHTPQLHLPYGVDDSNYQGFFIGSVAIRSTLNGGGNDVYPPPDIPGEDNIHGWRQENYGDYDPPGSGSPWHFLTAVKRRNLRIDAIGIPFTSGAQVAFYADEGTHLAADVFSLLLIPAPGSPTTPPPAPMVSWRVADDLPTEDAGRPGFVRRSLEIQTPISYEPTTDIVTLRNPVLTDAIYRGRHRNSTKQGGLARIELEAIEVRWQRAISKRAFIRQGTFTGQAALQELLTLRQTEFGFLQWEAIPVLHWPDGSVPTLTHPSTTIGENRSVFDEVLELLAAFPGYTLDWTPDDRLRIVIPPFAPNAPGAKVLSAQDGVFERTGFIRTDIVRTVRVKSQPFAFTPGREVVVTPAAVRLADGAFSSDPVTNRPDVRTRGSISAGSATLNVRNTLTFVVGDWLYIAGADIGGNPLHAQITSISGDTITLNATAATNASDVLVRYLFHYPPPPDNQAIITTDISYGPGYIEATYFQPFNENTIIDTSTVQASVFLDTWRLPALPPPLPYQTTDQAVDIPISAAWANIYTGNLRDRLGMSFDTFGGRIFVDARLAGNGVEYSIRAITFGDGGVSLAPFQMTIRRWLAGFRFTVQARASVWKKGDATYTAEYRNPDGYLDLPEVDVSGTGISDQATLQRLARLIAEYRSRQAIQWQLRLSQPWALLPTDKGRLISLPGGAVVVPDAYQLGITYGLQEVQAPMVANAWQYTQLTYLLANNAGDLLANNAGDVLGR